MMGKDAGVDKSLFIEQQMPGEFFADRDGVRKPVYGRRIRVTATLGPWYSSPSHARFIGILTNVNCVVSVSGYLDLPYLTGGAQSTARIIYGLSSGAQENTIYKTYFSTSPDDNMSSLLVDVVNPASVGKSITIDMFVTYIKN